MDTEAVIQDTFLVVWRLAPEFRPDGRPNALLRFAVTVAKNRARDMARKLRTENLMPVEPDPLEPGPGHHELPDGKFTFGDPLLRKRIMECFEQLTIRTRKAFDVWMRMECGRVPARAAAAVGFGTPAAYRQALSRARREMRDCLRGKGVEEFQ